MRLANVATPYGYRVAALEPDGILDLAAAAMLRLRGEGADVAAALAATSCALPADMMAFLAAGAPALAEARAALAFANGLDRSRAPWYRSDVQIGPVVPRPQKIFILRGNYVRHRAEMAPRLGTKIERPERPRYFLKPPTTISGPERPVVLPRLSREVHHEVELGVVIGSGGRRIPVEHALEHVAGFTIFLDMTARDLSGIDDRNKSFDTFAPIGPCLVPTEDIGDPHDLGLRLSVNGQLRQNGSTRDMEYRVPELVAFLSEAITLVPGDLISTGTPDGVGPVRAGDVIEAEIDRIGTLRVPVVAEADPS